MSRDDQIREALAAARAASAEADALIEQARAHQAAALAWNDQAVASARDAARQFRDGLDYEGEWHLVPSITHLCPPDGGTFMPCCGESPFDAPRQDRMTLDPALVTCRALLGEGVPGA